MVSVLMPTILSHGFPLRKTLHEVLKPLQHKFLLCAWRPFRRVFPSRHVSNTSSASSSSRGICSQMAWAKSGMLSRRLGRSSSFNTPSTWFRCADVSAKLPVLKDQGVCWNDDMNDGRDGGMSGRLRQWPVSCKDFVYFGLYLLITALSNDSV